MTMADDNLFRCTFTMDYSTQNQDDNKIVMERAAESKLDLKQQLEQRLNPDRDKTVVALTDRRGDLYFIHTMKVGDVFVEEVEK